MRAHELVEQIKACMAETGRGGMPIMVMDESGTPYSIKNVTVDPLTDEGQTGGTFWIHVEEY